MILIFLCPSFLLNEAVLAIGHTTSAGHDMPDYLFGNISAKSFFRGKVQFLSEKEG
jgi:hypothetical protein